jgi:hypothetical protein
MNAYIILTRKPTKTCPLVTQKDILEDNINTDLRVIGFEYGRWMELSQDRVQ